MFSITAQQAKWTPDPGAYNIFNGSFEADFPSPCVGITNAWTAYRKNTLRLVALFQSIEERNSVVFNSSFAVQDKLR